MALAGRCSAAMGTQNPRAHDAHYDPIRIAMQGVFQELGLAASRSTIPFAAPPLSAEWMPKWTAKQTRCP
jgi:hypothetical protein